jgi:hypothetical protein
VGLHQPPLFLAFNIISSDLADFFLPSASTYSRYDVLCLISRLNRALDSQDTTLKSIFLVPKVIAHRYLCNL